MSPRNEHDKRTRVHVNAWSLLESLPLVLASLCVLYVVKWALGINVLPDLHLSELFDF